MKGSCEGKTERCMKFLACFGVKQPVSIQYMLSFLETQLKCLLKDSQLTHLGSISIITQQGFPSHWKPLGKENLQFRNLDIIGKAGLGN